jgi:hypothetical protein
MLLPKNVAELVRIKNMMFSAVICRITEEATLEGASLTT